MANRAIETEEKTTTTSRRHHSVATVVVFALALCIGGALMYSPRWHMNVVQAPIIATSTAKEAAMPESAPVRLIIPKINLDTAFSKPLGLKKNGEVEVPDDYTSVGYYKFGPTPGEQGPAVILGHVDSYKGPAVFFSLGQLEVGDEVKVERADGTIATFTVTEMTRQPQTEFPTKKVYSDLSYAGLRLITCTGVYDRGSLRYSHNLIIYAKLTGTSTKEKK